MDNLLIDNKKNIFDPKINLNAQSGEGYISGESFMENAVKFYQPLFDWLKQYFEEKDYFNLKISLNYFNTSSSKIIYKLFEELKKYENKGKSINVDWIMTEEDDGLEEDIEEMKIDTGLNVNIKMQE